MNVHFDVCVVAFAVPLILAGFGHFAGAPHFGLRCQMVFADLNPLSEQHFRQLGECGESEDVLFEFFSSPSVVWALAPAVEASFHCAASAFCVVEWSGSRPSPWSFSQESDSS